MENLYEKPLQIVISQYELFVDGKKHPRTTRSVGDMLEVLMKKDEHLDKWGDAYYMYRAVYAKNNIRYDITVIPQRIIAGEYAKTYGHYHPKSGDGYVYPEIYQVIEGKAAFILQKKTISASVGVAIVEAEEGDTLVIPPGYGHVTVNRGEKDLILSNAVCDNFDSEYQEYKKERGAAYYYLKDGQTVQNTNYIVRNMEKVTAQQWNKRYGFHCGDILREVYEKPEKFLFLSKPSILFKEKSI